MIPPSSLTRRPWRRLAVVGTAAGVLALAVAAPASAHVTVHADDSTRGASDAVLAFRVPNERPNAATTKLEVAFPTATPLLGVLVAPHPGWTSAVTSTALKPPVKTDDGTVTEAVSRITWTANTPADAIPAGDYTDFTVTAGQLPDTPTLTFKALQTYSNGEIVRWIGEEQSGQPEPDNPAPVLTLTAAASTPATATPAATAAEQAAASGSSSSSDTTARVLGGLGIGLAVVFGAGGYLLGRRRPTRPEPAAPPQD